MDAESSTREIETTYALEPFPLRRPLRADQALLEKIKFLVAPCVVSVMRRFPSTPLRFLKLSFGVLNPRTTPFDQIPITHKHVELLLERLVANYIIQLGACLHGIEHLLLRAVRRIAL